MHNIRTKIKEDFETDDINEAAIKFLITLKERKDIGKYDKKSGRLPKNFKRICSKKV
ncbi:MAG: hypothetical protein QXD94_06590 [Sulfolobales archaeon]